MLGHAGVAGSYYAEAFVQKKHPYRDGYVYSA
jgi:hypothetical protein